MAVVAATSEKLHAAWLAVKQSRCRESPASIFGDKAHDVVHAELESAAVIHGDKLESPITIHGDKERIGIIQKQCAATVHRDKEHVSVVHDDTPRDATPPSLYRLQLVRVPTGPYQVTTRPPCYLSLV